MKNRRASGFTLIELMIVVVIAGVLATLATPSFQSFIAQEKIKTTAFDILSSLTLARSEAIKRNANVDVTPADSSNWQSGWGVAVGATALNRHDAVSGLTVTCKSGTTVVTPCPAITYAGNGRITGTSAPAIELASTASTAVRCISIDLSGRPNSKSATCP